MISVDDFLRDAKRKSRSKLLPFKDDIFTLKEADLSNQKICEFLKLNGIEVSHQRVAVFLKEQGFDNKTQDSCLKTDQSSNSAIGEHKKNERKEFVRDNLPSKVEFVKPSWVPEHINVADLK
ncbi:MAG TPA: hypothetical protein DD666_15970 [Advenella kashmirensis]|uniref:Uncharacterized protein n=1 Tax=Advenella kashmirensis TaxID=310575 RepID=A0A356LJZ6_9BURK|nr:hypothetical protein [Advenella kashmirensis]